MRSTGDEHVVCDVWPFGDGAAGLVPSNFELAYRLGLPVASKTTVAQWEKIVAASPLDES